MSNRAKEIIRKEYGDSTNFITPNVIRYELVGTLPDGHTVAAEVSAGTGIMDDGRRFGVSLALERPDGSTERLHDLSEVFSSMEDADALIDHVRESMEGAESVSDFYWES